MTATEQSPDHSICLNCHEPIDWDEVCYIHRSGFADCGVTVTGGEPGVGIILNPDLLVDPEFDGKTARPIEWGPA